MISLKAPDNSDVFISVDSIFRVRSALLHESEAQAKTRLDEGPVFVREMPEAVVSAVNAKKKTLVQLRAPAGAPIWLDGKEAFGPVRLLPSERSFSVNSAVVLRGKKQFLSSTPQQVADAITSVGGVPLPIPRDDLLGIVRELVARIQNSITPMEEWD